MSLESTIIDCANQVFDTLGSYHSEATYQNAFEIECQLRQIRYTRQPTINIFYKGNIVGYQRPDMIVNNQIVIEMKVCREQNAASRSIHNWESQLSNYLKDNTYDGMLIVFGITNVTCRRIFRNNTIDDETPAAKRQQLVMSRKSSDASLSTSVPTGHQPSQDDFVVHISRSTVFRDDPQ